MGSDPAVIPGMADLLDRDHALTSRQRRVLEVIRDSVERHGYPPSLREIGEAVGLTSASSVSYQLSILQSKGYLRRGRGRARTVEVQLPGQAAVPPGRETDEDAVTDVPSPQTVQVPVYGQLPAAGLAVATEAIKDVFLLPRQVVGEESLFLLQVADKCMKRRGIKPGDWVVVRPQSHADEGDIVAARFDGQTIVRIFRRVGSHGFLMPSDKGHPQIQGAEASIRGKVVALLARFG
jgi:repressor LexA